MVTPLDGGDIVAHLRDDPGTLVTECARQQRRYGSVAQRQIAVADTAGDQPHPDLVLADGP